MADTPEAPAEPPRCAAGCGFFGNPATENFCSKCFRDLKKKDEDHASSTLASPAVMDHSPATSAITVTTETVASSPVCPAAPTTAAVAMATAETAQSGADEGNEKTAAGAVSTGASGSPKKPKKPRCAVPECRKKLGMLGFECRCGKLFCAAHRHPDTHMCAVDYKEIGRDRLRRENQKVVADRVANKI